LIIACAVLAAIIAGAAVVVSAVVCGGFTLNSLVCAAVSGGVCLIAACGALVATYLGSVWKAPVHTLLVGMLFRLALPLVAIILLNNVNGMLPARSISSTIVGVYLIALVVETLLAVRLLMPANYSPVVIAGKQNAHG